MMPPLFTPVQVPPLPFRLDFDCGIVTLGSCFADEMATRLADGGFNVEQNPFGTIYNPASVATALERIIDGREITEDDLVQHNGLWHSWFHHGCFSRTTAAETLEACNSRLHQAHDALSSSRLLIVTYGTAWVFERVASERWPVSDIVGNCHKLPASMFSRRMMSVDEITALWSPLLQHLSSFNSHLSILFTVSPIRHMADGAHGNQLSKSTLLLAVDQVVATQAQATYYPAYEIVLDELRDYRFYGPDMTHPTSLAVDIVYDRLQQACMSPATIQQAHNNAKAALRDRHVPLH